jgi:hypothetical protein
VIAGPGAGLSGALFLLLRVVLLVLIALASFRFPLRLLRGGLIRRLVDGFDLLLFECLFEPRIFAFELDDVAFKLLYFRLCLGICVSQAPNRVDELLLG